MRALLTFGVFGAILLTACGTLRGPSGGGDNLPVSGGGPFKLIESGEGLGFDPPRLLVDLTGDFDHPVVLRHGAELAMWVTFDKDGTRQIMHTDSEQLEKGFESPALALAADQAWEGGSVFAPSVLEGAPWLMFYATGAGVIGLATSSDGHLWQKRAQPIFAEDDKIVTLPSAVRIGEQLRLYFSREGAIWAVEAPFASFTSGVSGTPSWQPVDGDLGTLERDPMLSALPFCTSMGRAHARVEATPAGRLRHDLFVGGVNLVQKATSGFAATFVGTSFEPFLLPIAPDGVTSPMAIADGRRALLFAVQSYLNHRVIVVGQSP